MDEAPLLVQEPSMVVGVAGRESGAARALIALGLLLWLLCALTSVWEALALQSPVSPLHLGVLSGPINQLRNACFVFGAGGLVLGSCWQSWFGEERGTLPLLSLVVGALAQLTALGYAAVCGLWAVQLHDPRADARTLVWIRLAAHTLTIFGLGALSWRALRRTSIRPSTSKP